MPITQPVAGIAMGLVQEGDRTAILSDILGSEDHNGDMDFKVAGSGVGITALQMDIKIEPSPASCWKPPSSRPARAASTSCTRCWKPCRVPSPMFRASRRASSRSRSPERRSAS
ncbi:MAG: hypothetical protein R3E96_10175 [Planctomycetota bacterium]